MTRRDTVVTTLGDLIAALTDATAAFVRDEREIPRIVAYILSDLLSQSETVSERRSSADRQEKTSLS